MVVQLRLALLRSRGYSASFVDDRIVIKVDDSKVPWSSHALYRRVWGQEWPTVRSDRWAASRSNADQLLFHSSARH